MQRSALLLFSQKGRFLADRQPLQEDVVRHISGEKIEECPEVLLFDGGEQSLPAPVNAPPPRALGWPGSKPEFPKRHKQALRFSVVMKQGKIDPYGRQAR